MNARTRIFRCGTVGSVLLSTQVVACASWRTEQVSPAQVVAERHPQTVRVTRSDQSRIVLTKPTIVGDTLMGVQGATRLGEGQGFHIPLADIRLLETRRMDPGRTIALLVGVPAAAILTFALLCTGECLER